VGRRDRLRIVDGGAQPAQALPLARIDGVAVTAAGAELPAFPGATIADVGVVEGEARAYTLTDRSRPGTLLIHGSSRVWEASAAVLPAGVNRVVRLPGGYLAVADRSAWSGPEVELAEAPLLQRFDGTVERTAPAPLPKDAAAMLREANRLRTGAGLPPLYGDPLISRAAANHSRYFVRNRYRGSENFHYERPGRPGFTGEDSAERCAAVGALCSGEIGLQFGGAGAGAVRAWTATAFHSLPLADPETASAGAGAVRGGPAVMDFGAARNVQLQPFGFPVGRTSADLAYDAENPDPVDACRAARQRIRAPLGTTVHLFLPAVERRVQAARLEVRPHRGRPLKGCTLRELRTISFLPGAPLRARTRYDVRATYTFAGRREVLRWSFRTR
jgi:uncharacterized protein YkwD